MKAYVLDTPILWWHLTTDQRKLGRSVRQVFEEAEQGKVLLYVPILVLVELWDINDKLGRPLDFRSIVQTLTRASQFILVPLDIDDLFVYEELSAIPNSRDRIIATATRKMDASLITVDAAIIASGAVPIFKA
jgi:PIN domain nuclease of toxin-antitoxin system